MFDDLAMALVSLDRDAVARIVDNLVEGGEDPQLILEECRQGMTRVGERFQQGDYYLAELLLSAEIFKQVTVILEPHLAKARPTEILGKVVLATLKGDIHDLGKNIVRFLLQAQGFEVHDMGVDIPPELVVEKVGETHPDFVGFSALITPTFDRMKEAAQMFEQAGLRNQFKLMVGGGVTTPAVKEYIGADFQTLDAMAGVHYCMKVVKGEE
jgi:methanogenic corrinoid protein MtbC1